MGGLRGPNGLNHEALQPWRCSVGISAAIGSIVGSMYTTRRWDRSCFGGSRQKLACILHQLTAQGTTPNVGLLSTILQ